MSHLKPSNAGLYQINALNVNDLYIQGVPFQDFIDNLVVEDQLEQDEITEIKLLLEYLDTTGLNSAWTVTNSNVNETLRSAITTLQTKLANIDTTALTQSSVLTNDNRNSVLKTAIDTATSDLTGLTTRVTTAEGDIDNLETRMTTAEGDIDGVETKTRFITEASVSGTGDDTYSNYRTRVGPADGVEKGSALIELNMKNGPANELIGYTIKSNFNNDDYADNESIYSHRDGRLTLLAHTMRMQATEQIRIGNFDQYGDGGASTAINIGGRGQHVNIGCIDSLTQATVQTQIQIGQQSDTARNTSTRLSGNMYLSDARFEDMDKSTPFSLASIVALMTSGPPSWVVGFFSGVTSFPYSDIWCMKGGFAGNKKGDVETRNSIMVSELYVVNKDIVNITPKVGFFLAKADYSCTQLIGDHRTQVFEGEIMLRNNNITSSSVDWALTGANDKCNVVNIGGDSGILIHQGASDEGAPLRIINSCSGNIELELGDGGTQTSIGGTLSGGNGMSIRSIQLTDLQGNSYTGGMVRMGYYYGGNPTSNPFWGTYQLEVNQYPNRQGIIVAKTIVGDNYNFTFKNTIINGDSINTDGTITGIDVVGTTSISAPTATAGSLVINANYTGNTDARLYKNADNKLMWNGAEVGAGGVSSGGITYMINVASNITNPAPSPTETIMTAAYSGNAQRTITQAITSNSAFYIAKYTTEVFDEVTNPVLTGLQQLNQYISWNSQNHTGQLYGQLWFQATAVGLATLYQRTYASPVATTQATVLNGTPIPTPKGLYNIKFQRVVFPNINVVVTSGNPVVLRYRVQGLASGSWTNLYSMTGLAPEVSSTSNNLTITLDESVTLLNQIGVTTTALRLVLYISGGTGTISQITAGGEDLAAYSLIGLGSNTPALFRTMLYDGTNSKITIPYSTTPTLVEYDLAIDAPYNVSAFASPTLSTDLYFIQPSGGGHGTNAVTLYFNEGTISHYNSTISPPQTTPTLAQVLNSGATASQDINMNSHKISGITTLEGAANGNWNVKEITAGTNISVTPTNGSYEITNNAPVQEVAGGTGIQISKNGTTATIINNAAVQSLTAGTGITIQVDTGTRNAIISNSATAGGQAARDQLSATSSVGLVPNKLSHYAQNWITQSVSAQVRDIFVSHDGRNCVCMPGGSAGNSYVQYSFDYGVTWTNSNFTSSDFLSICGSMTGEVLYIARSGGDTGSAPNVIITSNIFVSYNYGVFWSELTLDRTPGAANTWYNRSIDKIRCSSDGSVVMSTTFNSTWATGVPNNGTLYISTNGGAAWVVRNITAGPSHIVDCCMSANGAIMFAAASGVLGGSTDNGNGGIYRSFDFGATWTKVRNQIAAGSYYFGIIKCDATGRFLVACDQTQSTSAGTGQIQTSDDYGSGWTWFGDEQARGAIAAFVSPGGNLMITTHGPIHNSKIRYSTNYGRTWINAINFDTIFSVSDNLSGATIRTLASNHDGSLLLMRSDLNASKIYRCIEEKGKLELLATSRDLTMTPAFGGGYTLLNNPVVTLWATGTVDVSTAYAFPNFNFDNIDLSQYNIRYEIDCYWNLQTSVNTFISLGLNGFMNLDRIGMRDPFPTGTSLSAVTNWTNVINNGNNQDANGAEFNQTYRNRFYCGYSAIGLENTPFRYRTILNGELSLQRRPTAQAGITDTSIGERTIYNRFSCENYTTAYDGSTYINLYGATTLDYASNHQRINGTGLWAADFNWNSNNGELSAGINSINLRLHANTEWYTYNARSALYIYRIYRVRK